MDGCVWREREWGEGSEGREATSHELSSTYLAVVRCERKLDSIKLESGSPGKVVAVRIRGYMYYVVT